MFDISKNFFNLTVYSFQKSTPSGYKYFVRSWEKLNYFSDFLNFEYKRLDRLTPIGSGRNPVLKTHLCLFFIIDKLSSCYLLKYLFFLRFFFFYGIYDIHFYLTFHTRLLFIKKYSYFFSLVVENTKYTPLLFFYEAYI